MVLTYVKFFEKANPSTPTIKHKPFRHSNYDKRVLAEFPSFRCAMGVALFKWKFHQDGHITKFHLFMRVDSLWRTLQDEKILVNSGGIAPELRLQPTPNGVSQAREGGSASFDFVFTYSNHQTTGHLAATPHKRFTKMVPSVEDGDPFIRAAKAA